METCPKMPMINFDSKACSYDLTEFSEKILAYIQKNYQENPDSYHKEIGDLVLVREVFSLLLQMTKTTHICCH